MLLLLCYAFIVLLPDTIDKNIKFENKNIKFVWKCEILNNTLIWINFENLIKYVSECENQNLAETGLCRKSKSNY